MHLFSPSKAKPTIVESGLVSHQLPKQLETVVKAETFARERHRWNTNEEVASVLIAFDKHEEWQTKEILLRPPSGTMLLYSRKEVRYRKDGYCWKKRKDGKTTREDHMKLKVQGSECIYGCYVHSSILPTFHRRCYWLLQNPDMVLVHYLNVPLTRNNKMYCLPPVTFECRGWTREELESQIRPMFASMKHFSEDLTETSVQSLIGMLTRDNYDARNNNNCITLCPQTLLPVSTPVTDVSQKDQISGVSTLNKDQQNNTFEANNEWGQFDSRNEVCESSKNNLLLVDNFLFDHHKIIEEERITKATLPREEGKEEQYHFEIDELLHSFPPYLDDLDVDYHVKRELSQEATCSITERVPVEREVESIMDDLDDILGIMSTNLEEEFRQGPSQLKQVEELYLTHHKVIEFSPEWSYDEGGDKMLITGGFDSLLDYNVLFGDVAVEGEVVQNGTIKCTIPAHAKSVVDLKVLHGDRTIALCGSFTYKSSSKSHFNIQTTELEQMFIQRSQCIREQLYLEYDIQTINLLFNLTSQLFPHCHDYQSSSHSDLSLLHLASAMGNCQIVSALIEISKQENVSTILKKEANLLLKDSNGNIPIMWACARGHFDAFVMLFQACPYSMSNSNSQGYLPVHFIQQIGTSFFTPSSETLLVPQRDKGKRKNKKIQTTDPHYELFTTHKLRSSLDSRWPTDNDPCLPYRRSFQGCGAPTIFGSSKGKEFFKEQCRKDTPSVQRTSLEYSKAPFKGPKHQHRSDSLNEGKYAQEILDFEGNFKQIYRNSNSEPQLNENVHFPADVADTSQSIDHPDEDEQFSVLNKFNMEVVDENLIHSAQMMTLANQIVAAIPERIKSHSLNCFDDDDHHQEQQFIDCGEKQRNNFQFSSYSPLSNLHLEVAEDSGLGTSMEGISSLPEYRHVATPASTLSPTSTCVTSPYRLDSPTTTAEFTEYFNAPATYMEKDFSLLTLSDEEQRKLYEAARIIQNFYRRYKDEKSIRRQREIDAAVLIQNCYRRYKQFLYYKRMNQAAVLIQSQFRSYYAQKHFRRSREAATIIQNRYRAYKEHERFKKSKNAAVIIQQRFRSHYQMSASSKQALTSSVHKMLEEYEDSSQKGSITSDSNKNLSSIKDSNKDVS